MAPAQPHDSQKTQSAKIHSKSLCIIAPANCMQMFAMMSIRPLT